MLAALVVRVVVAPTVPTVLLTRLGWSAAADGDALHHLVAEEDVAILRTVGLHGAAPFDPESLIFEALLDPDSLSEAVARRGATTDSHGHSHDPLSQSP